MLDNLKDHHKIIIECLATFKYLTVDHMVKIGIRSRKQNLVKPLQELQKGKSPLIGCIKFGVLPGIGRLPYVYYLKKPGERFLLDDSQTIFDENNIRIPRGDATFFRMDYFHRMSTIDFHIDLLKYMNSNKVKIIRHVKIISASWYFDKTGANRRKDGDKSRVKTRIDLAPNTNQNQKIHTTQYMIPDGVIQFSIEGKKETYLYELSNGKNTKKIIKQLYVHALAIKREIPKKLFETDRDTRVLCLFEHKSIMQAVMARMASSANFQQYEEHFLFRPLGTSSNNFGKGWCTFKGGIRDFFGVPEPLESTATD